MSVDRHVPVRLNRRIEGARRLPRSSWACTLVFLLAASGPSPAASGPSTVPTGGFVGETRCGNPTCHGAGFPSTDAERSKWKPWRSARNQWLNRNIDRHSRAYATLETEGARAIAKYMAIDATTSPKCLVCHAPDATVAPGGSHRKADGVSCEHCHGPAQSWLKAHVERDWQAKKQEYYGKGFYDNANFKMRAERCASCHTDIDHEILAGGHPPLQFEMVAYAQIMKHWNDDEDQPPGAFSVDPTLWAVGQTVGLRNMLGAVTVRAAESDYQSIGKFSHFNNRNCYTCHHKLVADALRQAQGHYLMVDAILGARDAGRRTAFADLWAELVASLDTSADATRQRAQALEKATARLEGELLANRVDQRQARQMLKAITANGDALKAVERFGFARPARSNVLDIRNIDDPWWYTTGAPEQAALAIGALCDPAFGASTCRGILPLRKTLLGTMDRFNYAPDDFTRSLKAVHDALK